MDLLKSGEIAPPGEGNGMSHDLTCLVRVKETHQILQQFASRVGGGLRDFPVSSSLSCAPIGEAIGQHPANQHGEDLLPL
jgi:hypothetical protein